MIFILSCLTLLLLVGGYLFSVFSRIGQNDGIAASKALYNRRMKELSEDIESGELKAELAEAAEQDIVRVTMDDEQQIVHRETRNASVVASTGIAFFIVSTISMFTYFQVGDIDRALGKEPAPIVAGMPMDDQAILDAIEALKARLEIEPDNAEGWMLLGRTQMELGKYAEAADAFLKANELRPKTPGIMLQYADALAMKAGGSLTSESKRIVAEVLQLEPNNISALWLAGLGAAEEKNIVQAKTYLNRAREITASVGASTLELEQIIAGLDGKAPEDQHDHDENTQPDPHASVENKAIASAEVSPASGPEPETDSASSAFVPAIPILIEVSETLLAALDGNETLYVFARAEGAAGPPVAVRRETDVSFPFRTFLDQSMAMSPQFSLQPGQTVKVAARLSKSGQALPQPGDLIGNAAAFEYPHQTPTDTSPLLIVIDSKNE